MNDRPPDALSIAVAQLNTTVGDIAGNLEIAREAWAEAREMGADLLVLTELFLCGYPPEDLVLRPAVQIAAREAAETLAAATGDGPGIVVGCPWVDEDGLHNSVLLIDGGQDRRRPPQGGAAELRRLRRAARLPAGAAAGAGGFPRRQARAADLRGSVDLRRDGDAGGDRGGASHRAERLALLAEQGGGAGAGGGEPHRGDRPADHLRQPALRAGRAGLRRRRRSG